ncbi:MAG: radical SAM protein [Alphaproteobacteria bacterium]|nr:radical SAM protein [Alphaproteobacteria bacterium]MBT4082918.1 radical SAM protein [Alphaproteobacteria bacterium]MBT4546620.1 radical SAM protein [Alphaproteobacteria bacterium]MBT7747070.1 radical SAM protein [Alphaproteobacteria bacterium]
MAGEIDQKSGAKELPGGTTILLIVLPYLVKKDLATRVKTKSFLAFPYGVLTLASYVKRFSKTRVNAKILDLNFFSLDEIFDVIQQSLDTHQPDIIGMSMMFDQSYQYVRGISQQLKQHNPDALVLLGGASATTSSGEIIKEQEFVDAICHSEGETAIKRLVESEDRWLELDNDPWITKRSISEGRKARSVYVDNLNDVVDVDYDLVDASAYSMKEAFSPFASYRNEDDVRQFFVVTSRGCPFKCVFCAEPFLHGANMRYIEIDAIINHVKHLVDKYGMNVLTFYDDQLLIDTARAKELFRRLAKFNLRLEAPNGVTLVYIDDEMARLMKEAGFDTIPLAIESGSDYVLNKIIKKPLKKRKIRPVVEALQKNNIFVQAFFVIGLPGEMDDHRQETLQLIKDADLDWSGFSLASPVRGSELHTICVDKGYIDKDIGIGEVIGNQYMINAPEIGLEPEKITRVAYLMNLETNFVNNRQMRIGNFNAAAKCFEEVLERYDQHAFAHYYLAKAYEQSGGSLQSIEDNRKAFHSIIESEPIWQDYAGVFNLV